MLTQELLDKYAWVNEIEAWTVAVVEGRSAADVVRIYGGDRAASVGHYAFAGMADLQGDPLDLAFHLQAWPPC